MSSRGALSKSSANYVTPGGDVAMEGQNQDLQNTTVVAGQTPGGLVFDNVNYNKVKSASTINVVCGLFFFFLYLF